MLNSTSPKLLRRIDVEPVAGVRINPLSQIVDLDGQPRRHLTQQHCRPARRPAPCAAAQEPAAIDHLYHSAAQTRPVPRSLRFVELGLFRQTTSRFVVAPPSAGSSLGITYSVGQLQPFAADRCCKPRNGSGGLGQAIGSLDWPCRLMHQCPAGTTCSDVGQRMRAMRRIHQIALQHHVSRTPCKSNCAAQEHAEPPSNREHP